MRSWWKTIIITLAEGLPYFKVFIAWKSAVEFLNESWQTDTYWPISGSTWPTTDKHSVSHSCPASLLVTAGSQITKQRDTPAYQNQRHQLLGTVKKVIMRRKQKAKRASKSRACQMVVSNTYNRSLLLKWMVSFFNSSTTHACCRPAKQSTHL